MPLSFRFSSLEVDVCRRCVVAVPPWCVLVVSPVFQWVMWCCVCLVLLWFVGVVMLHSFGVVVCSVGLCWGVFGSARFPSSTVVEGLSSPHHFEGVRASSGYGAVGPITLPIILFRTCRYINLYKFPRGCPGTRTVWISKSMMCAPIL